MVLEAIKYDRTAGTLDILDQLQLPHRTTYRSIHNAADGFDAIKTMQVRGAPAIAIVAALSVAVQLHTVSLSNATNGHEPTTTKSTSSDSVLAEIEKDLDYLVTSRPTAVNLAGAAHMLRRHVQQVAADGASGAEIAQAYISRAAQMLEDDVRDNKAIGEHGRAFILRHASAPVSLLTHCNTGSLATAGWGTALGVIRAVHAAGQLQRAFCTETRPYNQGSRLTAYELVEEKIPGTLVTDSMAAALLRLKGNSERIAAVVVGADRVAANGDTANKIGTYALAVTAKFHGVLFLVAAPVTTVDLDTPSGEAIVIEERAGHELTTIRGPCVTQSSGAKDATPSLDVDNPQTISVAARGIDVWNPAFDVTPAALIDGIITEHGVVERSSDGSFPMREFLQEKTGRT